MKEKYASFRVLFEQFYPKLMSLARRYVDEDTAKDIVQEVFVSYWEKKDELQIEKIHSFLYKWVQNKCLDHIKRQTVIEEHASRVRIAEARLEYIENTTDNNEALNHILAKDLWELVDRSIDKLPPKCKVAFRLSFFSEMTYKEIGDALDISPRTVEKHVQKAISFLRTKLDKLNDK